MTPGRVRDSRLGQRCVKLRIIREATIPNTRIMIGLPIAFMSRGCCATVCCITSRCCARVSNSETMIRVAFHRADAAPTYFPPSFLNAL